MDFGKWLEQNRLSSRRASLELELGPATVHRIVVEGQEPSMRNAARIVHGTGGEVDYEDLLQPEHLAEARRFNERLVLTALRLQRSGRKLYGKRRGVASDDAA